VLKASVVRLEGSTAAGEHDAARGGDGSDLRHPTQESTGQCRGARSPPSDGEKQLIVFAARERERERIDPEPRGRTREAGRERQ